MGPLRLNKPRRTGKMRFQLQFCCNLLPQKSGKYHNLLHVFWTELKHINFHLNLHLKITISALITYYFIVHNTTRCTCVLCRLLILLVPSVINASLAALYVHFNFCVANSHFIFCQYCLFVGIDSSWVNQDHTNHKFV